MAPGKKSSRETDASPREQRKKLSYGAQRQQLFDRFKKIAFAIAFVGFISFAIQVYGGFDVQVPHLKTAKELKDAFFGGRLWVIQCVGGNVGVHDLTKQIYRSIVSESTSRVGLVSCSEKMPSGNTFWKRFGIKKKTLSNDAPTLFMIANGDPPKLIASKHLKNATAVVNHVLSSSVPSFHTASTDQEFKSHCRKRKACVLIFHSSPDGFSPPWWMEGVIAKYRTVRFVSINTVSARISFESQAGLNKYTPVPAGSPHVIAMQSKLGKASGKSLDISITPFSERFDEPHVTQFLDQIFHKHSKEKQIVLPDEPKLSVRTVKKNPNLQTQREVVRDNSRGSKIVRPTPPQQQTNTKPKGRHHIRVEELQREPSEDGGEEEETQKPDEKPDEKPKGSSEASEEFSEMEDIEIDEL